MFTYTCLEIFQYGRHMVQLAQGSRILRHHALNCHIVVATKVKKSEFLLNSMSTGTNSDSLALQLQRRLCTE
jgi:hypothetical protein